MNVDDVAKPTNTNATKWIETKINTSYMINLYEKLNR